MITVLDKQYELVRESRRVLLEYCAQISKQDLIEENSSFGRGSIRNLLVHIANTYEFWIGKHGLGKEIPFTSYESKSSIREISLLFEEVDGLVTEFLNFWEADISTEIELQLSGKVQKTTSLKLFTHVITHEFHHKGQILSLSRHLGYVPVDTDIMR